jgi:3-oxoadipate enol-lactonase
MIVKKPLRQQQTQQLQQLQQINTPLKLPSLHITGSGQPFIWLHGMLNSVESDSVYSLVDFDQVSKLVSVVRYNVCEKAADANYSWDAMTNELIEIAKEQNYDAMILGGCSMGSGTAIHAAVRFPEKVKALILVTPPPAWEIRKKAKAVYHKVASKTHPHKLPELLKRIIELNEDPPEFFEEMRPGTRQRLLDLRLGFEPAYYSSIYTGGAVSDFPSREQIAQITVPTLIISIPNDEKHPIETARELHSLMSNSELVLVSGSDDYRNLQGKICDFLISTENNNKS